MKKTILIAVLVFMGYSVVHAQSRGYVGGTINMNFTSVDYGDDEKTNVNLVSVIPSISWMLDENWSLGFGLGYMHAGMKDKYDGETWDEGKLNLFLVRPSLGYYLKLADKFYYNPMMHVGVGFGKMPEDEGLKTNLMTAWVGISPLAFEFRPSDRIGLTFDMGKLTYRFLKLKYEEDNWSSETKFHNFNWKMGSNFEVGMRYYF